MADEFDIVVHDVDEIDIDASVSDEVEITLSEVDDIEIMVFDYPADIDLLTSRVKACEDSSTTAVDMAEQAVAVAGDANSLASQSAQAAQQAAEIAEGAAISAGEAVQAINEHAQAVTNPHATNVTQEFAEVKVTTLKDVTSGGIVADTVWTWLGATASSVLSVVSNLITKVFNLYPQTGLTFSGSIDLSKVDTHYSNYTQTGILGITIAANSIVGGSAEITITANGSAITVTGATQYGDTAIDFTNGKINHFLFTKFSNGIYYSVKQLN